MNQDQRKFLIEQVQTTAKNQIEELENQMPDKPSLNNYLVAAFLDNSIRFNDIDVLKSKMRERVLAFGTNDALVEDEDGNNWRSRKRSDITNFVKIHSEDLFIIPENYMEALAKYEKERQAIDKQIESIRSTRNTIVMKIQIGSSSTMDKLVMQIDNMGDLDLVNNQLLLGSEDQKKLTS